MYSRPASPRPTRSPVRGTAPTLTTTAVSGQGGEGSDTQRMSTYLPKPKLRSPRMPVQAQGRDVISQNGQRGVVGRGGNFQPLGTAALNRFGTGGGGGGSTSAAGPSYKPAMGGDWEGGRMSPDPNDPRTRDFINQMAVRPLPTSGSTGDWPGAGAGAGAGGDIQTAIQGLKSQLGMPADADAATRMSGFGPNVQGMGPAIQTALAGANGGNPNSAPGMPPDVAGRLRAMIGGGLRPPQAPASDGGRGGTGFMPGQPNPYAEILRQRLGAGGGGGVAGQYAY